ncbi:Phosphomevalonate kinase [Leucosporidium creatinivorum]|uniref:Phosphomevalonate kinase n=1 Tax=Leucosporidium creatinivorum TaxID=106004 RepID=A0A1Y2DTX8_9BASI|nr:Phosphomevalonate kinase [Leucosporidium creatinivorum]
MNSTVVSCPGKVLIAGGYLVLSPQHQGFVVSTPSRFYTVVQPVPGSSETSADRFSITVKSPQFTDGQWEYVARKDEQGEWTVDEVKKEGHGSNSFIHLAIGSTLLLSSALSPSTIYSSLLITIVGSNDFYSQSREDNDPIPFAPLGVEIKNVHKTGLGSSAAMVSSLTSALLLHWDSRSSLQADEPEPTVLSASQPRPALFPKPARLEVPDKDTLSLIHNLAQYVHSLAQGKVGSGFDVSAAVYGSHVYRRFAVECLGNLLSTESNEKVTGQSLLKTLSPPHNPLWTTNPTSALVSPFGLPPGVILILADVDAGSNTPSMVGKVLAWKKAQPEEAKQVWDSLKQSNSDLAESFRVLSTRASEDADAYEKEVQKLSATTSDEWSSSSAHFATAAKHILTTRSLMRKMGEASGVPIEPPEQTKLLDACSAIPGVIGAGVPGAGGYDAIWVLALAPSVSSDVAAPEVAVEKLLRSYTEMSVRPLSRRAWVQGGRKMVETGLLREELEAVEGLRRAVGGL